MRSPPGPGCIVATCAGLFHCAHHIANSNSGCGLGEANAAGAATLVDQEAVPHQRVGDLERMLQGQIRTFGQVGDANQGLATSRTFGEHPDGVIGLFGQTHERKCFPKIELLIVT